MRSKTWEFECAEHEEYGSNGWRLKGAPNADPLGGLAVAHDVLEHPLGGDMGVEDELMALGASLFVRKWTRNMHSLGANVASDMPDIFRHVWYEGMTVRSPGRTVAIEAEYEIDNCFHSLRKEAECDEEIKKILTSETKAIIRGWMRRGYRAAVRRWGNISTPDLFKEIEEQADRHLKHAEQGQILKVRLTYARGIITDQRLVSARVWLEEFEYNDY